MTLKKTLSFFLALTLILGLLAPGGAVLHANAQTTLYGDNLEQVTEPVIGESYYLGADVEGTMMYFRHGAVTDTVPYSLVTTDNINHNWCYKLTLESSMETDEKFEGGFQFTYTNPTNGSLQRIYCMDVLKDAGQTGVMDTGLNSTTPYKNRHSFFVDEIEGVKILRKYGNDNVLVIKQLTQTINGEEVLAWRMLGVPAEELTNDGVYPVMLLQEHSHTYGNASIDADNGSASRTCTSCSHTETVYGNKLVKAEKITVGNQYYLAANVGDTMYYVRHGAVTETVPYSLPALSNINHNWVFPMTFAAPVEGNTGFQITYTNPSGTNVGIYCYDVGADGTVDTGINATPALNTHTYFVDTVDGDRVLRCLGNDYILAIKQMDVTSGGTTTVGYRMLGVSEAQLADEGVYPVVVLEAHTHEAVGSTYKISDSGHSPSCWCGGYAAEVAHTYGAVTADAANNTHSRSCSVCGYTSVVYGNAYAQVKSPAVGEAYYLAANVDGQLLSFLANGGYTETTPYSLKTSTTLSKITLNAALEAGKGEFQLIDDTGKYIYSVAAGAGATTSSSYIKDPSRVSFLMDQVNGQNVIRAYGTKNVLVAKYSETKSAWRIWCLPESKLANEGVYPVVLLDAHEHTYTDNTWVFDTEKHTQSHTCNGCGHVETMWGADSKVTLADEPVIGESYYLVANVDGTLRYFIHGVATETAPYSLRTSSDINHNWAFQVTLEDSKLTDEEVTGGFQFTYTNPDGNLVKIYSYDVLKDSATLTGQTGVADTGIHSGNPAYKNRHSFYVDDLDGVSILRKMNATNDNHILVVKEMEFTRTETNANGEKVTTTGTEWRMLSVPEAELANEGVYPVMLANAHTHTFGEAYYGDANGHWHLCECGSKSAIEEHTVESWTVITPPTETEPGSKSGVCTVCGETAIVEAPVTVNSWNIVLSDNIGVNFVLALTEGDTVAVTVDGEEVPATLTNNGNGTYTVFIKLAAAQMADEIAISVNGYAVEKTYSVRAYADEILAGDNTSYTKALVQNMLVYGGAAQTYFGHNAGNLASDGIEVTAAVPGEAPELVILNELTGVKYYGASLLHKEKTAVRFYFTAESIEGLRFMVDGNVYEAASNGGLYYIEVAGINPQDLDDTLNVVVTDGVGSLAVQYSPLTYISRMYSKAGTSKALVQAMYGYHLAAKAYLANLNLADDFALQSQSESVLYEGVTLYEKTYVAAGYGEVEAYIIAIDADANVELKVSAGAWNESNNGKNPAEAMTVANHFRSVKNAGNNVLAMINGGFFDLNNTGSNLPYGMQVVDGNVKQAPSTDNSYSDNWFGMTKDGKYVISNAAGYAAYEGNVQQAVGGGKLLIVDGVPVDLTSDRAYRTAVGVNADGDLVMVAVADATYSDVCHIFVDMGLDIETVLNLDGGGSTAMYVPGAYYPKALILGDDGFFPPDVAVAVAIVVKK